MIQPPQGDQVQYLSLISVRRMFNESQYPNMIADGQLTPKYLRNDHLKEPETKGEPYCTRGQMIRYLDNDRQWAVEVFQYLRPDRTIGGSGRPDPKRLRIGNTVFIAGTHA